MTRTEPKTSIQLSNLVHARCSRASDCACGQQLDHCVRAHCPRCGRSLGRS